MKKLLPSFKKKPSEPSRNEQHRSEHPLTGWSRYMHIVYIFVAAIGLGLGGGYLLDRWFALKQPLFKVLCAFGGAVLGLYVSFKELNKR